MGEAARIASVLGGPEVLGIEVTDVDDLVTLIRRGLPVEAVDRLEARTGLGRGLIGKRLTRSGRVRPRRAAKRYLRPGESDRAVRIARVFVRAEDVLQSPEKASLWLQRPNRALGMIEPGLLLDTDMGTQMVIDVLGRIEHGTFG